MTTIAQPPAELERRSAALQGANVQACQWQMLSRRADARAHMASYLRLACVISGIAHSGQLYVTERLLNCPQLAPSGVSTTSDLR